MKQKRCLKYETDLKITLQKGFGCCFLFEKLFSAFEIFFLASRNVASYTVKS